MFQKQISTVKDLGLTLNFISLQQKDVHVSHNVAFDPNGSGEEIWEDLWEDGRLDCSGSTSFSLEASF